MHLKKEEQQQQQVDNSNSTASSLNFFSRLASIPIIQDSFVGATNIVRQHSVGQKALDYAETKLQCIVISAQPYLPNEESNILSRANCLGNKSLDLLERQFPSISSPTNQLVEPITGRIESAVSHLRKKKSTMIDPRIDYIANGFESLLDQYLPPSTEEEEEEHQDIAVEEMHGMDRLMYDVNLLSNRASKKISKKASATVDEERQIKQMIRAWVLEQANMMTHQQWPVLQEQMESFKTKLIYANSPIQVMYDFTQTEFDKVRQELNKPNISHMDRIRSILAISQTDILLPLYQKSRSMFWRGGAVDDEQKEQSSLTPATA